SDTIAAIAGAFSGAYNGLSAIPEKFLKVEDFEYIKGLGEKLCELALGNGKEPAGCLVQDGGTNRGQGKGLP
ncbi:MAG TPA: ADP-ribosylglycohydrolase family protein, partial [Candidatus Micrarchaeota archaeon]|nr:ADP-ribosylglycohydrolase family protein [Candidatus Micrarchaeota archaeon]